jgi:tRNA-Thr(GGU) m(6)t(6)A37 methyltransferase TsaA
MAEYFTALAGIAGAGFFVSITLYAALAVFRPSAFGYKVRDLALTMLCLLAFSALMFAAALTSIFSILPAGEQGSLRALFYALQLTYFLVSFGAAMYLCAITVKSADIRKGIATFVLALLLVALMVELHAWMNGGSNPEFSVPIILGAGLIIIGLIAPLIAFMPFAKGRSLTEVLHSSSASTIDAVPVGVVHNARRDRSDVDWGGVESTIELDEQQFTSAALQGLEHFSHAEIVYFMHGIAESHVATGLRRPRENPNWPLVGIFAQRGARRPNRIGVSRCKIVSVEGATLRVRGLDAIDGTPVLDVKPYMREFGPIGEVAQPAWASEVMERYFDE